ncbi:MAG: hypothetical protein IPI93_11970 [Sphingobacteriaceae bacterium]|nr:hypothetical protein [Sphingobacteriaceae bacterium]
MKSLRKIKHLLLFLSIALANINLFSQTLVKNIEPGSASSNPTSFYPFKNKLVFSAYTSFNGWQFYITDGSSSGTQMLTNIPNTDPNAFLNGGFL